MNLSICEQIKNNLHVLQFNCQGNVCELKINNDDIINMPVNILRNCMTPQIVVKKCNKKHYKEYMIKPHYKN
jgi:hypothetical protein